MVGTEEGRGNTPLPVRARYLNRLVGTALASAEAAAWADLGYLPMTLEQAAAYIQYAAITPTAYADRLERYPARMFAATSERTTRKFPARTVVLPMLTL